MAKGMTKTEAKRIITETLNNVESDSAREAAIEMLINMGGKVKKVMEEIIASEAKKEEKKMAKKDVKTETVETETVEVETIEVNETIESTDDIDESDDEEVESTDDTNESDDEPVESNYDAEESEEESVADAAKGFFEDMKTGDGFMDDMTDILEDLVDEVAAKGKVGFWSRIKSGFKIYGASIKNNKLRSVILAVVAVAIGVAAAIFIPVTGVAAIFTGIGIGIMTASLFAAVSLFIDIRKAFKK